MNKLLQALLLLPLFVLGACGGGADGGPNGPTKPINSYWSGDGHSFYLNLVGMPLNTEINTVNSDGDGFSIIALGGKFSGTFGLTLGTGCYLVSNDLFCTEFVRTSGSYSISNDNRLELHTTYADIWDGSDHSYPAINAFEYYK